MISLQKQHTRRMYKIFFLLFLFSSLTAGAQSLYKTRDVAMAYQKGTRSAEGRPGPKYWQNRGRYAISLELEPKTRVVRATEQIDYVNNSPDTLHKIVFKLIMNHHKPTAARWGNVSPDYLTEGVSIDKFLVDGKAGAWKDGMGGTATQELALVSPLLPGKSVRFDIDWRYTLAKQYGREGMIDSGSFYLAYFHPRVAVYDDYNGWDMTDHINGQEFYNDFNDYQLNVTVPANYIVWATGELMNSSAVLQADAAKRLKESLSSTSVVRIATKEQHAAGKITRQQKNTWKFKADNIVDVAVGISNHFVWDGTSAIVDSLTRRRASMQTAYNDTTSSFRTLAAEGAHALNWYSHHYPGVPYPFSKMTAFQGNANMEAPGMINDSSLPGIDNRRVANHEIAHTWFPFYMGTNETRYAFMDEAWASFLELLIAPSFMDSLQADEMYKSGRIARWANNPAAVTDIPIITPSSELKDAYRTNAYGKPSLAYMALKGMLGDKLFKKCLLEYMDRWHGKHPIPWDFFYTFNDVSGMDLNWFWHNWFFTPYHMDIRAAEINMKGNSYELKVVNTGGFAIPFSVQLLYANGSRKTLDKTASVWEGSQKECTLVLPADENLVSVFLDTGMFVDYRPDDNTIRL